MVTLDARDVGAPLEDRSTRRYTADDAAWASDLLARTVGRDRFRRGAVVSTVNLPGLVALVDGTPAGLVTLLSHRDEVEVAAVAAEPGDETTVGQLLNAVTDNAGADCRRVFIVCYNAELGLQRLIQQNGFRLCTARPGSVVAARHGLDGSRIPLAINGVAVRDEIEYDLLMR